MGHVPLTEKSVMGPKATLLDDHDTFFEKRSLKNLTEEIDLFLPKLCLAPPQA